jgi:hypothetical protein
MIDFLNYLAQILNLKAVILQIEYFINKDKEVTKVVGELCTIAQLIYDYRPEILQTCNLKI